MFPIEFFDSETDKSLGTTSSPVVPAVGQFILTRDLLDARVESVVLDYSAEFSVQVYVSPVIDDMLPTQPADLREPD